jgi:hypothetical protein
MTSVELKAAARAKIIRAKQATANIDHDLWRPIERLKSAGATSNGDGIYADWERLRSALVDARSAIDRAIRIVAKTNWPTDHDYDIG